MIPEAGQTDEIDSNLLVIYSHSLGGKETPQNTGPQGFKLRDRRNSRGYEKLTFF